MVTRVTARNRNPKMGLVRKVALLRVLNVLAETLNLVPKTYSRQLTPAYNTSSKYIQSLTPWDIMHKRKC